MKERSLVAFTLLAQMAVGAVWTAGLLHSCALRRAGLAGADELTRHVWPASGSIMLVAVLASFFHLGTPTNAWRALANLRSSWLSREILSAVLFAATSCLLAVFQALHFRTLSLGLTWLAGLAGLGLVVSMANAYRLRTVPTWNTWVTFASFMLTALALGGLLTGVILTIRTNTSAAWMHSALQWIASSTVIWIGLQILVIVAWLAQLSHGPRAAAEAMRRIQAQPALLRARVGLAALALVMAGTALSPAWAWMNASSLILLLFALVAASEILGRLLFYETQKWQIKLGG